MAQFVGGLTEDQIETRVSRMIDRLDSSFMAGNFNQEEYNSRIKEIDDWSEKEYRFKQRS